MKKLKLRIPVPQKPPKVIDHKKIYDRKKDKKNLSKELKDLTNGRD